MVTQLWWISERQSLCAVSEAMLASCFLEVKKELDNHSNYINNNSRLSSIQEYSKVKVPWWDLGEVLISVLQPLSRQWTRSLTRVPSITGFPFIVSSSQHQSILPHVRHVCANNLSRVTAQSLLCRVKLTTKWRHHHVFIDSHLKGPCHKSVKIYDNNMFEFI